MFVKISFLGDFGLIARRLALASGSIRMLSFLCYEHLNALYEALNIDVVRDSLLFMCPCRRPGLDKFSGPGIAIDSY